MTLLEQTERQTPGRWLLAPKKGEAFLGVRSRAQARARERRRRVFVVLLEALGITFLIGLFPPLRGMWWASLAVAVLLGAYCVLLVHYKEVEATAAQRRPRVLEGEVDVPLGPAAPPTKYQLDTDPSLYLGVLGGGDDHVHVTVRPASELEALPV